MIRAIFKDAEIRVMEEGLLHKRLSARGFNVHNPIKRTAQKDGTVLFEQFPAPSFRIRPNLSEFIDTKAEDRNKRRWEREGDI